MTIKGIIKSAGLNGSVSPLDREILLSLALKKSKEYILAHPEKKLAKGQIAKLKKYIKRRSAGEPIAYITGQKEFFGLDFGVNKNVLIPRPETELLVELAINKIQNTRYRMRDTIIDVGTGSGNIIVSIAKNLPRKIQNKTNFFAADVSRSALRVARQNAQKHKVDKKIKFIQSDLLEYFPKNKIKTKNILIVANLPYVSPALFKKNESNLCFEPKNALISPQRGLRHYKRLLKEIGNICEKRFVFRVSCCAEISPEQKPQIGRIARKILPKAKIQFFKDLAGKWRIAMIEN